MLYLQEAMFPLLDNYTQPNAIQGNSKMVKLQAGNTLLTAIDTQLCSYFP